ncbi:MAG: tetratricopeptide repeat protein [Candidatus Gastranaerophilales bacterium]|nr:tetratricopeptide repeat protein [Candidatus Gastranaerophilales bacterium]
MKKGILFLVLFFLSGLLWMNAAKANELTDDYFDMATNYFCANNYAKALEYLDLIITIEPTNIKVKALKDKISPPQTDSPQVIENTAKVLSNSQKPENVVIVDVPQADISKTIYNSDYYNIKGQEFYCKKDFCNAIEYFHKAITVNKCNAQAYNNLAMAYWARNNTYAAIKYFKKGNSLNRAYTQPLVNLSNLYKQLGNEKKQVYYLKKAIKLNPNDYSAYYWLGNYCRNYGDYPSAIANYKECIKINPKFPQAYLSIAISFFETEEFNYAIIALKQYREFYPDSDFAFFLTARAASALCRYEEAKIYVQKALEINNCNEYKFELAKIDYFLGNYINALDVLQELLKCHENAEYFNYVGLCYYKQKNIEAAIANFNKAIDLDGLRPIYYYNLAQCYKSLGDKKNYAKYVNTATKINPINYQDFIDLSYIYYDNGNTGYAINSLNNAISKYPNVKLLYLAKLKIYEALSDNLHYNEIRNIIEMRFNNR